MTGNLGKFGVVPYLIFTIQNIILPTGKNKSIPLEYLPASNNRYHTRMDKYELRRQKLITLRDERCNGKVVEVAKTICREPSYVSRMLYPEGKKGKKRIADDMVEVIELSFNLPRGWMNGVTVITNADEQSPLANLTPRQKILLELFEELPDSEADNLLKTLEEKKQYYDHLYRELDNKRKSNKAS